MEPQTFKQVREALRDRYFQVAVDLGCGFGEPAKILKKHCDYLIGVDRDIERVTLSGYDIFYNEIIEDDVRCYWIPPEVEAAFLFDLIEHLEYEEGLTLLSEIGSRFCIVTTPTKFFPYATNGHLSLWTPELLESLGFRTVIYKVGFWTSLFYGMKVIGVRGGERT